jgi:outer membrane beta-barrel protein
MKQAPLRLVVLAALAALHVIAYAPDAFAQKPPPAGAKDKGKGKAGPAEVEDLGGEETPAPKKEETPTAPGPGVGSSFICEANPEACNTQKLIDTYAGRDLKDSQVYAVQQIYALRKKRFELTPYWGASLNDQFVSHGGPGVSVNYYVTNVLAVGFNFNYYQPFNSEAEFNKLVRQSTRLAVPINEYAYGANLNFSYVPLYGKFAGFGNFIFHWDGYVVGGIGAISTRPIAVIDPENRAFKYKAKVAFNVGIGFRVFFNRYLSAFLEVRDYIYNEQLENTKVESKIAAAKDPATWLGESRLTNAVHAQFGMSIFLPLEWQYRLPK